MATGKISKVFQHWADETGAWNNNILSANKSEYAEGEVIPHVFIFKASNQTPLINGQEYTFTITYNNYQANTNAGGFAFITDFNTSRDPGSLPGASPGEDPEIDSTFDNGGGIQGSFYTVDADIIEVSDVTFTGTGTRDGQVTVTFVYTGEDTTNGIAEIYFGLQIAAPGDVPDQGSGPTNGASAWTGGSLQTTVDIGGSGATSIQLSPAAIVVLNPELNIVKTADPDQVADVAGEQITYTITVENTGDQPLTGITVTDPFATTGPTFVSGDTNGDDILDVDETWTYTASHTVTQDEIDTNGGGDGFLENTATADSDQTGPDTDDETVPVLPGSALNIVKDADPGQVADEEGELITYAITVENTGNTTLTNVVVTDDFADPGSILRGADVSGDNDDLLEVGETWSYTAAHTVTQAEIDSNGGGDGSLENTATADSDQTGPDTDDASVPVGPSPGISLIKTGHFEDENGDGDADVGETISYTFAVTNTGNVTLTNVTVTDPKVDVVGGPTTLDIGETDDTTFTGTYVLTQEDIDAEQVDNTATADSDETDETTDDETVPLLDDAPVVGERDISVDEDFLAAGNQDLPVASPGDDGGLASSTDDFPIDFGSDFDGATVSFADLHGTAVTDTSANPVKTSDGNVALTYFWDEDTDTLYGSRDATDATTAAATAAFSVQVTNPDSLNDKASYVFTLHEALEHGQTGTPNTENPNIFLDLDYVATDADGDEEDGTLGITIDDDIPIRAADAEPITTSVKEDGMSTTAVVPEGLNGPDQSDGNKESGETDEDDQKSSLVAGSLAALVAVGADAPGAFGLDSDTSSLPELFSNGEAVTYDTSDTDADGIDDTLVATAGGRTVFTLKVNTDGTWDFDLDDQLDHVDDGADDENVDLVATGGSVPAIDFSSIIQVTDADGDTVNVLLDGDFTVAVEDDIPVLTDAEDLEVANAVGPTGTATGQATFSVGADEAVSFVITEATGEEGVDYTISGDGKTVTGHMDLDGDGDIEAGEDLYTFTINDDGEYTFTLLAPLPPPDPVVFSAAGIKSGDYANLTLSNSGLQLVIDALDANEDDTSLQVSQASGGGIGVGQNTIEQEESVTFSFEKADGTPVATSSFTLLFKADAGNPDYVWTATLEDGVTEVILDDGGVNNPGGDDVTFTPVGSGDRIATVELASGEKFTDIQLTIVGDQNDKVKLGLEGFSFTPATPDVNLAFDIEATDADGDTATLQTADLDDDGDLDSLAVHIEADGDPTTLADAAMQTFLQSSSSSV